MRDIVKARALFDKFIKNHEIYTGQINCSLKYFRRDLMIPILTKIKELENKTDE